MNPGRLRNVLLKRDTAMMTLYGLKSRFQDLLRPRVQQLAERGVTANQVTIAAAALSVALGALLIFGYEWRLLFLLLPVWLFVRMALNAADGMLAREHGQKSDLGAYLNELGDVVADAALYVPFVFIAPFSPLSIGIVVLLAVLTEYAGVMGPLLGAERRYDGPFGKSDRALVFGALGLAVALWRPLPDWFAVLPYVLSALLLLTIANRVRKGIAQARERRGA